MKRKVIILVLFSMFLLLTGCMGEGNSKTEKESIKIDDTKSIKIDADSTDIEVISEERDDISAVLYTYTRGPHLKVASGKTAHISAKRSGIFNVSVGINYSPKLMIYIPSDYEGSIDINNISGELELNDLNIDELSIDVASGDINGNDLTFQSGTIISKSGDVDFKHIDCKKIDIDSMSGAVNLEDFTGEIKGSSMSGDVNISYKEFAYDLDYKDQSGEITVNLNDQKADAKFDLSCSSGEISVLYDVDNIKKQKDDEFIGTNGKGTNKIKLRTSSGDITIR